MSHKIDVDKLNPADGGNMGIIPSSDDGSLSLREDKYFNKTNLANAVSAGKYSFRSVADANLRAVHIMNSASVTEGIRTIPRKNPNLPARKEGLDAIVEEKPLNLDLDSDSEDSALGIGHSELYGQTHLATQTEREAVKYGPPEDLYRDS